MRLSPRYTYKHYPEQRVIYIEPWAVKTTDMKSETHHSWNGRPPFLPSLLESNGLDAHQGYRQPFEFRWHRVVKPLVRWCHRFTKGPVLPFSSFLYFVPQVWFPTSFSAFPRETPLHAIRNPKEHAMSAQRVSNAHANSSQSYQISCWKGHQLIGSCLSSTNQASNSNYRF